MGPDHPRREVQSGQLRLSRLSGSDQRRVTQTAQWVLNRRPADLVMTQRGALDELPWLVAKLEGSHNTRVDCEPEVAMAGLKQDLGCHGWQHHWGPWLALSRI